ncbi:MAG TPA: hypothetical protein VLU24_12385 [Mycobacterium sp.]|nr:hypothetical protein [Mycobacterium sp.]
MAAMVTGAAVVGALVGGRLVARVDPNALRKLFGWFVMVMASVILAEETDPAIGAATAGLTLFGAGFYLACTRTANCPLRRLTARSRPKACQIPPWVPLSARKQRRDTTWLVTKTALPLY